MPEIAVIIPHYADVARLERCLQALVAQDLTGIDIIVGDNATPGGIDDIAAAFPQIQTVIEPQKGAAAARNCAVGHTAAPWLAFLDADCVPAPDWIDHVREIACGDAQTVTGGRVSVFDETPIPRSGAEAFETVFAFDQHSYIRDKGFSVTANLITSRATFDAVGPFIVGVSEDLDWCHRATAAGYHLAYDPTLVVSHPTRSNWSALAKKWKRLTEEEFGLSKSRLRWVMKAMILPASVLMHLPKVLMCGDLSLREALAGAGTLLRLRMARAAWMLGLIAK